MKQTPHNPQKLNEQVFEHLFGNSKNVIKIEEVRNKLEYLLYMLTRKQKKCLLNKLDRCSDYIRLIERGMEASRVRSIIKRKHEIQRQNINQACEPCSLFLKRSK